METQTIHSTVYVENTPNPATMKFVANRLLVDNGATYEYTNIEQTKYAPLATQLFTLPFVKEVFISRNFISITKNENVDWNDMTNDLRELIQDYLNTEENIFIPSSSKEQTVTSSENKTVEQDKLLETEQKIVDILEQYVRPAVEGDGGAIHFKSYENGVVTVILRGACSGCPSATYTLKAGIENLLIKMVPEVKEVVAHQL